MQSRGRYHALIARSAATFAPREQPINAGFSSNEVFCACLSCMSRSSHRSVHNSGQPDREGRAATGLTLDRDVAAHHLTEAFADRQTKARASVFARRGGGSLGKLLEQLAHLLRRHSDAGVGNRDRDPVAVVLLPLVSSD
jgi:hypothetical protein